MKWMFAAALLLAAALVSQPASAQARLGLGADYAFVGTGLFELTLSLDARVARRLAVTGRFGGLLTSSPGGSGIPLDAGLRFHTGGAYLEALAGPWFVFNGGDAARGHAAFGFGLEGRSAYAGVEIGILGFSGGSGLLGARIGLRL